MITSIANVLAFIAFPWLASRAFYYSAPTLTKWYKTSNLIVALPCFVAAICLMLAPTLRWGWKGAITIPLALLLTFLHCRKGKQELNEGQTISVMFLFAKVPAYGKNVLAF